MIYKDFFNNKWIEDNTIKIIWEFAILWNYFEFNYCNKNCSVSKINSLDIYYNEEDLDDIFNYFKDRYIVNGEINNRFNKLNFNDNLKKHIKDNLLQWKNKITTILHIIYRFRNNMFHWEKDIRFINEQKENFKRVNKFLYSIIKYD